jgi:hypothetical protein
MLLKELKAEFVRQSSFFTISKCYNYHFLRKLK